MILFLLRYASVMLYMFDLLVATTGQPSQPDRNNKLHENWLLTSWILMLAWAIRLSHWTQSQSCEILYETCPSIFVKHPKISLPCDIVNCFIYDRNGTFKDCSLDIRCGIWLIFEICPIAGKGKGSPAANEKSVDVSTLEQSRNTFLT